MNDADKCLEDGRKYIRLACDSADARSIEHYAEMGCDYLQHPHDAAQLAIVEAAKTPKSIAHLVPRQRTFFVAGFAKAIEQIGHLTEIGRGA